MNAKAEIDAIVNTRSLPLLKNTIKALDFNRGQQLEGDIPVFF